MPAVGTYKTNFLKEVIVRIDFDTIAESVATTLPRVIRSAAVVNFPLFEKAPKVINSLKLVGSGVEASSNNYIEWNFFGARREKRLAISMQSLFITTSTYSSYTQIKQEFLDICNILFKIDADLRISRFGFRYFNLIPARIRKMSSYQDFIDPMLLKTHEKFVKCNKVNRIFNIVEFNYDRLLLKFQFGIPNADFPATIRVPDYVLDYDAYTTGLFGIDELPLILDESHAIIQHQFEDSITDKLRNVMNVKRK
jgi:uncharacterized protein (TIGR04255 family)